MHVEIYEAVGGGLIAELVEGGESAPIDQHGIARSREAVPYAGTESEFAEAIWRVVPGAPIIGLDGRVVADAE